MRCTCPTPPPRTCSALWVSLSPGPCEPPTVASLHFALPCSPLLRCAALAHFRRRLPAARSSCAPRAAAHPRRRLPLWRPACSRPLLAPLPAATSGNADARPRQSRTARLSDALARLPARAPALQASRRCSPSTPLACSALQLPRSMSTCTSTGRRLRQHRCPSSPGPHTASIARAVPRASRPPSPPPPLAFCGSSRLHLPANPPWLSSAVTRVPTSPPHSSERTLR